MLEFQNEYLVMSFLVFVLIVLAAAHGIEDGLDDGQWDERSDADGRTERATERLTG